MTITRQRPGSPVAESAGGSAAEQVNRPVWERSDVLGVYAALEGWSDPGEWRAVQLLAPRLRGARILDLGVGSGRTTTYLRLLTPSYVGIDYTPAMVEQARARHPDADIRFGDARDLSAFADASFDAVCFSFNGIDAVGHADRALILAEIARVLRPGGVALYSTFNQAGPELRMPPWRRVDLAWQLGNLTDARRSRLVRIAKSAVALAKDPARPVRELRRWRRLLAVGEVHESWAMAPSPAHGYSLLVHLVTPDGALDEAASVGLDVEQLIAADGTTVYEAATGLSIDVSAVRWFHVIARRREL